MKVDILAIGVHPDDIELSCSGTLLAHIEKGKTVALLDLTKGELGTRGNPELRRQEATNAAGLMGAKARVGLDIGDGFFTHSKENILQIISVIRQFQPEIVLINAPEDRHPDHGRAGKLVADACYYSGLLKIETVAKDGTTQTAWRPKAVYHYIQDYNLEPDFVVDITPFMDKKIELIQAFSSQFYAGDKEEDGTAPQTPISSKEFIDFVRAKNATYGRHAGFQYGEGFISNKIVGVQNLFDLS